MPVFFRGGGQEVCMNITICQPNKQRMWTFSKSNLITLLLIGVLVFSGSTFLSAGDQENQKKKEKIIDIETMSLEDLLNVPVTVASKSEEKAVDAPSSVTVFTRVDIENMGITSLEELLNYAPGFQVTRDIEQGTASRISSRGRSSALSESVLFLVDGQRINDLYTGGVSILNRLIAVENIKQVEIIRGPGSALYGSNAFLGVVNIVTVDDVNRLVARVGSPGSKQASVNLAKTLANGLSLVGFVKMLSDDGYHFDQVTDIFGESGATSDPVRGHDAQVTLKYKNFSLHGRYMERNVKDFLTFGALANFINDENSKQLSVTMAYSLKINEKFKLDVHASYLEDRWQALSVLLKKDIEVAPGFALSEHFIGGPYLESYSAGVSADTIYNISEAVILNAGVTYSRSGVSDVKNLFTHHPITLDYLGGITEFSGELSFNEEKTRDIFGAYIQGKVSMGNRLSITAGIRFDQYSDFGGSLNPRAAVIYSTPFGGKIKVMYGRAFRAPNFLELYDKNNPVDFGNPDLNPEKVETIELAYAQTLKNFQASLTYFHSKIKDLIVLGDVVDHPDNPLGAPAFLNEGQLTTEGLEFELKASPFKNLIISGTFTHLFDAGTLVVSSNFASFMVNVQLNRINLNVNGIYRDAIDLLPGQDEYVIANTAISYRVNTNLKFQVLVKNIFDTQYHTFSLVLPEGVWNRGRTITAGMIYKW